MNKLQKKIIIFLIVLAFLTPVGILLPVFFDAGDAWGEWSAETVEKMIGYVPEGLEKYSDTYQAPVPDYTVDTEDPSIANQSVWYILSAIGGVAATIGVTFFIGKLIIRKKD